MTALGPLIARRMSVTLPFGRLLLGATGGALVAAAWASPGDDAPTFPGDGPDGAVLRTAASQLAAFADGRGLEFTVPLRFTGSPFQLRVWHAIAAIPFGATRDYAAIAEAVGSAPRAVGGACGRNRIVLFVPCHRVVARGGLGGYSGVGGRAMKQRLLAFEGRTAGRCDSDEEHRTWTSN